MAELQKGDKAPAFTLADQTGKSVSLQSLKGKKVLLYFYPKADTPGCTTQACSVRDNLNSLRRYGVEPLGVSPDAPQAQKKFDDKFSLGFPLLCDTEHSVAEAYGVWAEKSMYGKTYMGISRSSFLIDEEGRIAAAWYRVKPEDTVPNAMAALSPST
jgi:thioredoxin-dependent peroxiredoxin